MRDIVLPDKANKVCFDNFTVDMIFLRGDQGHQLQENQDAMKCMRTIFKSS